MSGRTLVADVTAAAAHVSGASISERSNALGQSIVAINLAPEIALVFYEGVNYPNVPPAVQVTGAAFGEFVCIAWPANTDPVARLRALIDSAVAGPQPYRLAWGHRASQPLTEDAALGARLRLRPLITGAPLAMLPATSVTQRVDAEVADVLRTAVVMIVGLGSAGSYLAEQFARLGVGKVIGVDNEEIETHNLTRTAYELADVGERKTAALARRILAINPETITEMVEADVKKVEGEDLRNWFSEASLVIAATDDIAAQNLINSCAHHAKRAALFVGLYRRAEGGEVVWTLPGVTPCYSCCTGSLRDQMSDGISPERSDNDYGRLKGEIALVADIHHVLSAALKIAVSLLCLSRPASRESGLMLGAIERGLHMATFGMVPDYWFYPEVFRDVAGSQYAFQSVWLRATSWADCQVCGENRDGLDPFVNRGVRMTAELRRQALDQMRK